MRRARAVRRTPPAARRCLSVAASVRRYATVPLVRPERITIAEVAPRDGLQAEDRVLPTETKLELLEKLADAGHTWIEATSFVSPKAVPQLADAEDLIDRKSTRLNSSHSQI